MNDYIRREPILRLRPYLNPHAKDTDQEFNLSVKVNQVWRKLGRIKEYRENRR